MKHPITTFGLVVGCLLVTGGAYGDCFERGKRIFRECSARCDYQVDRSRRDFGRSSIGTMNKNLEIMADIVARNAQEEGLLTREEVRDYRKGRRAVEQVTRNQQISMCVDQCRNKQQRFINDCRLR